MAKQISIRRAERWDLWPLEVLLDRGIKESDGLLPPYDVVHCAHVAINLIAQGSVFVAVELDESGQREKVIGSLMLDGKTWAWNKDVTILESVHFYILPEHRGQKLADGKTPIWKGLLAAGQALSDHAGVPMIINIIHKLDDEAADLKDEAFKRAGLNYVGGNHLYIPQAAADEKAA